MNHVQPTIREVAAMAGVSIATVSRVLNKSQNTAPELREKVREAAKALGYKPNPAMAAMAARHFHKSAKADDTPLAHVMQVAHAGDKIQTKIYHEAVCKHVREMGYSPELYVVDEKTRPAAFSRMLYYRGVAGVILDRLAGDLNFFKEVDWKPFSVVSLERRLLHPAFDTVRPEIFGSSHTAWNQVIRRGYKRIGFVLLRHHYPDNSGHPDDDVRAAFDAWVATTGLTVPSFHVDYTMPYHAPQGFVEWVETHNPDLVIGFNNVAYFWLHQMGLKIPKEIGFASLNITALPTLAISGIEENRSLVARAAAERLDALFRHGLQGIPEAPQQILVSGTWIEGKTLRPPPKPPKKSKS